MGRIEEAIEKLQKASGVLRGSAGARVERPPGRLATVVAQTHAYAGKHVEFDRAALTENGLLAPDSEERHLAEQYRTIKRPLLRKQWQLIGEKKCEMRNPTTSHRSIEATCSWWPLHFPAKVRPSPA